jgi:hypothetical protein
MKYYFALDGAVQYEYYWTESKSSIRPYDRSWILTARTLGCGAEKNECT